MQLLKNLLSPLLLFVLCLRMSQLSEAMEPLLATHTRTVLFSPDGKLVAALGMPSKGSRGEIGIVPGARVWTVADGKGYRNYSWAEAEGGIMAFSPDSQFLALLDGGTVKVVHLPTNRIQWPFGLNTDVEKLIFSPDGRWLIAQSHWHLNPEQGEQTSGYRAFEYWPLAHGDEIPAGTQQRITTRFFDIHYSPTGPKITGSDTPVINVPCDPNATGLTKSNKAFSSDGKWQAIAVNGVSAIQIWDTTTCQVKRSLTLPPVDPAFSPVAYVWLSPRGRWLLCSYYDKTYLWDLTDEGSNPRFFSPDLGYITRGLETFEEPLEREEWYHQYPALAFSQDELHVAITRGCSPHERTSGPIAKVYDLSTGESTTSLW